MKVLLVTSEITFVPRNYRDSLERVFSSSRTHIAGLVIFKNLQISTVIQALSLCAAGAPRLGSTMLNNILRAPLKTRERLFKNAGLPVYEVKDINDPAIIQIIKSNGIDLAINMRTRCIYRKPMLNAPRLGCINIHHGLLPEDRGTMCDLRALAEGRPAGFSIHVMNEKIDDGNILFKKALSNPREKNYVRYLSRTGSFEGQALGELINEIGRTDRFPEGIPNISNTSTYSKTPKSLAELRELKRKGMVL